MATPGLHHMQCIWIIIKDIEMIVSELVRLCVWREDVVSQLILFWHCFLVENERSPCFPSDRAFVGYTLILCKCGIQLQVTTVLPESLWLMRQRRLWMRKANWKQQKVPEAVTAAHPSPFDTTSILYVLFSFFFFVYFTGPIKSIAWDAVTSPLSFNAVWFSGSVCCNHDNSSQTF